MKAPKDNKGEVAKDEIDNEFKKEGNRDSGQNDSGQTHENKGDTTNDNKGDTTNSKEKDSKDCQKNSDQFFDIFNSEELIESIDDYVKTQLR